MSKVGLLSVFGIVDADAAAILADQLDMDNVVLITSSMKAVPSMLVAPFLKKARSQDGLSATSAGCHLRFFRQQPLKGFVGHPLNHAHVSKADLASTWFPFEPYNEEAVLSEPPMSQEVVRQALIKSLVARCTGQSELERLTTLRFNPDSVSSRKRFAFVWSLVLTPPRFDLHSTDCRSAQPMFRQVVRRYARRHPQQTRAAVVTGHVQQRSCGLRGVS